MPKQIEFEQWREKYCPILDYETSWVKTFETFGEDLELIKLIPDNFVWTLISEDDEEFLLSGKHLVNRMLYVVCANSWEKKNIQAEW